MRNIKFLLLVLAIGAVSLLISQNLNQRRGIVSQKASLMQVMNSAPSPPKRQAMRVEFEEVLKGGPFPAERISTRRVLTVADDESVSVIDNQYTHEGKLYYTHRKLTLSGGILIEIVDSIKSISSYRAQEPQFEDKRRRLERWNPDERCSVAYNKMNRRGEPIRKETILGYEAVVFESSGATANTTNWVVPALDCLEVRRLAQFADTDGKYSKMSDLRAVRIQLDSATKDAFEIPAGFDYLSPSEVYLREAAFRGIVPKPSEMQQFVRLDEQYRQNRHIPN